MIELAIILPTLNERGNLAPLLDRLHETLGDIAWEAIVVDDDSPDGTAEEARRLSRTDPRMRAVQRIGRRGLASAVIEGACATAAPYVAVMDADHQHDPALIPEMLAHVRGGEYEVAVASRFVEGGSAAGLSSARREKGSDLANRLARKMTGVELADPMSGFFVIEAAKVRELAPNLSGIGFKILLDILAAAPVALKVKEVPMQFACRREGESKLDRAVAFEFLIGLYDRAFGRFVPTRFALFGTVGALGVAVHLTVLTLLFRFAGEGFALATTIATFIAMSFNFWLNNWLTYRDKRLAGVSAFVRGWAGFIVTCLVGAMANVAIATLLQARGFHWVLAALAGIVIGSVWNYALSSRFVWGKF
ncbi:glycosyltransferase family 2 protein [Erythrobacter sp. LQ02-29]|uniref:glycosyltransferase family 2 protein n=1 Tax=Erythrobacter sp. LQ02-29 TaxID=2920384 RepID=UPI001F4E3C6D|nr:glycosyltransferase family 2 protein [Erythrobacter sp. LQ02-29]